MMKLILIVNIIVISNYLVLSHGTHETTANHTSGNESNTPDGKHELLAKCIAYTLDEGEYVMFPNGTIHVEAYNKTYNSSFYFLYDDKSVTICSEIPEDHNPVHQDFLMKMSYLTQIGLGISMVCLFLHLIVFAMVPDLRNLPGYNLASLCTSLFFSYVFLMVANDEAVNQNAGVCVAAAALTHFFLLASFLWMFVMSFDVYRSLLQATGSLRVSNKQFKMKKYAVYSLFSWGISSIVMIVTLIVDNVDGVPFEYQPMFVKSCWFENKPSLLVFFAGPVFALTCLNFIFFGLSAYTILTNRMNMEEQDSNRSTLKKNYLLYFRLAVIMGVTWVTGVVAAYVDVMWLWYLFAVLNTLQGLFIFLAFTCTSKVIKYFQTKWVSPRRSSEQTLNPTFQSYCFYANSIEKDLDKIVDKGKEKLDTIIIHL